MKEGWEYKKLGEVCDIYQPKTLSKKDFVDDGEYFVYGANGVIGKHDHYNHECSEVLLGCRGSVGTVTISKPFSWINGNAMVIRPRTSNLLQTFLAYQLRNIDLSRVVTGIAQPQITRQSLSPTSISIPSLAEQQHIVEELDLLSSIKEKKNNQLNELDNLAQSLFYEMFGDPMNNEKRWIIKTLGELASFKNGLNYHPTDNGFLIKCIGVGDFQNRKELKEFDFIKESSIDEKIDDGYYLTDGDIIIVRSNGSKELVGRNMIVYPKRNKITYSGFCIRCRLYTNEIIPLILNRVLSCRSTMRVLRQEGRGCNISNINQKVLSSLPIVLPPLDLQHQFASKIEVIERQKELIQKSIKEVETLFNSRMDYYFN